MNNSSEICSTGDKPMVALTKIKSQKLRESFSLNQCLHSREFAETIIHFNGF